MVCAVMTQLPRPKASTHHTASQLALHNALHASCNCEMFSDAAVVAFKCHQQALTAQVGHQAAAHGNKCMQATPVHPAGYPDNKSNTS